MHKFLYYEISCTFSDSCALPTTDTVATCFGVDDHVHWQAGIVNQPCAWLQRANLYNHQHVQLQPGGNYPVPHLSFVTEFCTAIDATRCCPLSKMCYSHPSSCT